MWSWPTERQLVAFSLILFTGVALTAVTMYAAGALYLLLNHIDPAGARITSILDYWYWSRGVPEQREWLQVAIASSAGGVLVVFVAGLVAAFLPWRQLRFAARFANLSEIANARLFNQAGDPGIVVGKCGANYLTLRRLQSVMLVMPAHSGVGVDVVVPSLLCWRDSVVVLDIDDRTFDVTAGFRASSQPVFSFSPFDEHGRSHCWNPLSAVREDKQYLKSDLLAIAEALFPGVGQEHSDAFFHKLACDLFVALGLMLFELPELPRTMGEMFRQVSNFGRPGGKYLCALAARRRDNGQPLSSECGVALTDVVKASQGALHLVLGTLQEALSVFAEESVDAATSGDDIRLEDVRREQMSIYVRVPRSCLASAGPLLNLFLSQLVALNMRSSATQDANLKCPCLLVIDEFTALGRIDAIASNAGQLGDHHLRLLTVVRDLSQLDAVYGWRAARTFMANHAAWIFDTPLLQGNAEVCSTMLGDRGQRAEPRGVFEWVSRQFRAFFFNQAYAPHRPFAFPQELREMGSDLFVLITRHCRPVLAHKIPYHCDKTLRRRLRKPPVVPCLDTRRHKMRVQRCLHDSYEPVGRAVAVEENADAPLVRDLAGLASRLEATRDESQDMALDRFAHADPALVGRGRATELNR